MEFPKALKNDKDVQGIMYVYRVHKYHHPLNEFMRKDYGPLAEANIKVTNYLIRHKLVCPLNRAYFLLDEKMQYVLDTKKEILHIHKIRDLILKKVTLYDRETKFV